MREASERHESALREHALRSDASNAAWAAHLHAAEERGQDQGPDDHEVEDGHHGEGRRLAREDDVRNLGCFLGEQITPSNGEEGHFLACLPAYAKMRLKKILKSKKYGETIHVVENAFF